MIANVMLTQLHPAYEKPFWNLVEGRGLRKNPLAYLFEARRMKRILA